MTNQTRGSTGWQLQERGPAAYEQYLVPGMFSPWADRLIERAAVSGTDRVLDVGCGTGIVAREAEKHTTDGGVVGLDLNEAMLAEAAAIAPSIEWEQGDATDLPFEDGRFDIVLCQQALQFIEHPGEAFGEMHRVLAPGGRMVATVWRPIAHHPSYVELANALEHHVGEQAATMMRSPFPEWGLDDLRQFAESGGFEEITITIAVGSMRYPSVAEFVRREAASSPLADHLASLDRAVRDALVTDVRDGLERYIDDDGIIFPMETSVVVADR